VIQAVVVVEGVHAEVFQCDQVPGQKAGFPVQPARPLCKSSGQVQNLQLLQSKVQGYKDHLDQDFQQLPAAVELLLNRKHRLQSKFSHLGSCPQQPGS